MDEAPDRKRRWRKSDYAPLVLCAKSGEGFGTARGERNASRGAPREKRGRDSCPRGWLVNRSSIRTHVARLRQGYGGQPSAKTRAKVGGERGIRTLGRVSPTHAFQACSFNHSDISPCI